MKEKGKLRELRPEDARNFEFGNLVYDGRYVWVSSRAYSIMSITPYLLVMDPVSGNTWKVTAEDGLPFPKYHDHHGAPRFVTWTPRHLARGSCVPREVSAEVGSPSSVSTRRRGNR